MPPDEYEGLGPSTLEALVGRMAEGLAQSTEELMRDVFTTGLGVGLIASEVERRGRMEVYPDGREVFVWDDKPCLEWHPPRFEQEQTETGITIRVVRDYRKL